MIGRQLVSIQYLRAVAAGLVVFFHCRDQFPGFRQAIDSNVGTAGVDLFFVISGFIMVVITTERETTPGQFMLRRLVRVAPIYWFFTTLIAAAALAVPFLFRDTEVSTEHYLKSMLFWPHQSDHDPDFLAQMNPLVKVGWTLNFEMFFYAVFALALFLPRRFRVAGGIVALSLLVLYGHTVGIGSHVLRFYAEPIVLEFCFGMLIGWAFTRSRPVPAPWALLLVAAGVALYFVIPAGTQRVIHYGIGSALIVAGTIALEPAMKRLRLPLLVGDASYSVYLGHLYPIVALRILWTHAHLGTTGLGWALLFLAVGFPAGIACGVLAYTFVERPMLEFCHALLRRPRVA